MKTYSALVVIFLISLTFPINIHSQNKSAGWIWSEEVRITSGFDDSNPKFGNRVYPVNSGFRQEFMVFERKQNNFSNIFLMEFRIIDTEISQPVNLSNNNSINKNAVISYNKPTTVFSDSISSSLVIWQSNRNGKWDLYGKKYFAGLGWSDLSIDTGSGDKINPDVIFINDSIYVCVYEKSDDIFYTIINTKSITVNAPINITNTAGTKEKKARITNFKSNNSALYITFEREKADSTSSLYYCRSFYDLINFNQILLLDSTGNNTNVNYFNNNHQLKAFVVYDKTVNGVTKLKCRSIDFSENSEEIKVLTDSINESKNYQNFWRQVIIDNTLSYLNSYAVVYQKIATGISKLYFGRNAYKIEAEDSITLGNSLINTQLTMNYGFRLLDAGIHQRVYVVYTKDSGGVTSLYSKNKIIYGGNVSKISSSLPNSFSLYQNYPNPFNAGTKIRFALKDNNSIVNLSVYDVSGRLVKNLLNEKFDAGEYEYLYNAEELSSGVYFYSLKSGDFLETKRMVLVK